MFLKRDNAKSIYLYTIFNMCKIRYITVINYFSKQTQDLLVYIVCKNLLTLCYLKTKI